MTKQLLSCGLDVHYKESEIHILDNQGKEIDHLRIKTNYQEFSNVFKKYQQYQIQYAIEACGMTRYVYNILNKQENTKQIHIVNPSAFRVIAESKYKNDKNDSKHLAHGLLKDYLPLPIYMKSQECSNLQTLLNLRQGHIRRRVNIVLQTKAIVRKIGAVIPTINLASQKAFLRLIATIDNCSFEKTQIEHLMNCYIAENNHIENIEEQIQKIIASNFTEEYNLLTSIPRIGFITAASLIAVIGDISRFKDAGHFSSYCGIVPSEHSSGDKTKHGTITKKGNKLLRCLLIQASWGIIHNKQTDPRLLKIRRKYYRMAIKQKNSKKAIVAIARTLTRIIYAVLKYKQPYCGIIEEKDKNIKP